MATAKSTRILAVDPVHPQPELMALAAAVIRDGGLVAFPTETVYGLGANALDRTALEGIFAAKGRPFSDPLIVHIARRDQLGMVARAVPPLAVELAGRFWPGPLTLVLRRSPDVPATVSGGLATVAVRMPNHAIALSLIEAAGVPIAAPSANLFMRPSPTTAQHVLDDLNGRIDMVLDGGPCPIGLESTVLDMTCDPPQVLRPGGAPVEALRELAPAITVAARFVEPQAAAAGAAERPAALPAPGMFTKHYSPHARLLLVGGDSARVAQRMLAVVQALRAAGLTVGVLAADEDAPLFAGAATQVAALGSRYNLAQVGRRLFAGIRSLDRLGLDAIVAGQFTREGLGLAIWDRLLRAAEGAVIDAAGAPPQPVVIGERVIDV